MTHMGQLLLFRMTVNSPLPTQKNAILSAPKYQAKYIIQKSQKLHQAYTIYLPYYKLSKSRIKSLNIASKHKNRAKKSKMTMGGGTLICYTTFVIVNAFFAGPLTPLTTQNHNKL